MKKTVGCLVAAIAAGAVHAGVYYVNAGVAGGDGSGGSWENAAAALPASVPSGVTEIWVTTNELRGASHSYSGTLAVRGGFVGTENAPEERLAGLRTVIDGHDTDTYCFALTTKCELTFERFLLTHARQQAFYSKVNFGKISLVIQDCDFVDNGLDWDSTNDLYGGGRAIWIRDDGGFCQFQVRRCTFAGNCKRVADADSSHGTGVAAVFFMYPQFVSFRDCSFVGNGVALDAPIGADATVKRSTYGSAVFVYQGGFDMERCMFVGNRVMVKPSSTQGYGCTVGAELGGKDSSSPCRISHCLFLGNEGVVLNQNEMGTRVGGALGFYSNQNNVPVHVEGCTFAYNCFDVNNDAAGLTSCAGTVNVRNCIFYGNRTTAATGRDIRCKSGTINVDYSLVTAADQASGVTLGEHMQCGDPKFETKLADFESCLTNVVVSGTSLPAFIPDAETVAKVLTFDAHVRSCRSKAVDTGDPASEWSNEPKPNGRRVNLGYYGNTSEAMTSSGGLVLFVR